MDERTAKEIARWQRGIAAIDAEIARVERDRVEPVAERLAELKKLRYEFAGYLEDARNPQPLTPEEIESLRRGLEEMRQGRCRDVHEVLEELRTKYNLPKTEEKEPFYHLPDFVEEPDEALRED